MEKKFVLILSLMVLILLGFVAAVDKPSVGILGSDDGVASGEDVGKIQEAIDDIPIDPKSGEFDFGKFQPFLTKAEIRIDTINLWLDDNVGWMKYIFHMKPAISLLFFINLYVLLWFFVVFFLNAGGLWFFIEEEKKARIFGFAIFVIFMVARLYYGLAIIIHNWGIYLWNYFVTVSVWLAIIGFIVFCFIVSFSFPLIASILAAFNKYRERRTRAKRDLEMKIEVDSVNAMINQVGKNR